MPFDAFKQVCRETKDRFAFLVDAGFSMEPEEWPESDDFREGFKNMTLFHVIGILLYIVCVAAGAKVGYHFYGFAGSIIGAMIGFGALYLICKILMWDADLWPSCHCGNAGRNNFDEWIEDEAFGFIMKCNVCGKHYQMRKGNKWYEITPDRTKQLYMKKKFLRRWKFE